MTENITGDYAVYSKGGRDNLYGVTVGEIGPDGSLVMLDPDGLPKRIYASGEWRGVERRHRREEK